MAVPFLYTPAFYISYGLMAGLSLSDSIKTTKEAYGTSLLACWGLWLPLQTINFGFVPRAMQASFMNTGKCVHCLIIFVLSLSLCALFDHMCTLSQPVCTV